MHIKYGFQSFLQKFAGSVCVVVVDVVWKGGDSFARTIYRGHCMDVLYIIIENIKRVAEIDMSNNSRRCRALYHLNATNLIFFFNM